MNRILFSIATLLSLCSSCKKGGLPGNASLNVIQSTLDVPSVYVYFTISPQGFYLEQTPISEFSSGEFGITSGSNVISIVASSDTTNPLFQGTFDLHADGIYSLYIVGKDKAYDTLFMQDQIPYFSDSSAGLRFINLSLGSQPMSVNLEGNPGTQMEFSNLSYKQISTFNKYSAASSVGGTYNFEIRQQSNDSVLATFSWTYTLQRCNTIVIGGLEENGLSVFQVNNF